MTYQDQSTFQFVELFAGKAAATHQFRLNSMRSARLDLLYMEGTDGKQNPMDLTTPAGFANLV